MYIVPVTPNDTSVLLRERENDVLPRTPLADALISLRERDIASFHALPLSQNRSISDSPFSNKYQATFGSVYPQTDVSYSGCVARAQAVLEGESLVQRSIALAKQFCTRLCTDETLSAYSVNPAPQFVGAVPNMMMHDPTKVSINISRLGIPTSRFKTLLFEHNDIYVARDTGTSILINFHIGVNANLMARLLEALRAIQRSCKVTLPPSGFVSDSFIIPYPPGVPLVVPGDIIDECMLNGLQMLRNTGVDVFCIKQKKIQNNIITL